ncbi:hypothetical protein RAS2_07710 [Phycisphaerae bacterium RAS2]|nr:hypothetical protein RAS2_07710 [Phycisphaerae bacterium RAS2]
MEFDDRLWSKELIPKRAYFEILDLASEDYTPLFDCTAVVRPYLAGCAESEVIDTAKRVVRNLLKREYLELYYDCLGKSKGGNRHGEKLTPSQAAAELHAYENWLYHEPKEPDDRWVTVALTPHGENALASGEFADL